MLSGREKRRDPLLNIIKKNLKKKKKKNSFMIFRLRHNYQLRE